MRQRWKYWAIALAGFCWTVPPAKAENNNDKGTIRDKKPLSVTDCPEDLPSLSKQILCSEKKIPKTTDTGTAGVRSPKLKKPRQR